MEHSTRAGAEVWCQKEDVLDSAPDQVELIVCGGHMTYTSLHFERQAEKWIGHC